MQEGLTALMEATKSSCKDVVKALVEGKADTNIADKVGWGLINTEMQAEYIQLYSMYVQFFLPFLMSF